jgi:hypothetical protein
MHGLFRVGVSTICRWATGKFLFRNSAQNTQISDKMLLTKCSSETSKNAPKDRIMELNLRYILRRSTSNTREELFCRVRDMH